MMKRRKPFGEKEYKIYSDFVKSMPIVWDDFKLNRGDYRLVLCDTHDGEAASYYAATNRDGFDIYLWKDLDEWIQRPLIFHELVEIYHRELGMDKTPAHNATMPWEKRFCEEHLDSSQLERLLQFKKEQGYDGFNLSPNS